MIIESMLDNDLYKFTMMQAVLHQFPSVEVEYKFKCRSEGVNFNPYIFQIIDEIDALCRDLRFTRAELDYLGSLRFIKPDFIQFLKLFKFERNYIDIGRTLDGELDIRVKGPWLHTILFEVPILAIISEIYSVDQTADYDSAIKRTEEKIAYIKKNVEYFATPFRFADFGTRRRHSSEWHYTVVAMLKEEAGDNIVGTSNVWLAKELKMTPIGTMAHEWVQAHQGLDWRLVDSQKMAFENWAREYRGDLGIALSDTIGVDAFLRDFDMFFAKLFDGTRQDSGDPYEYAHKIIAHYRSMNIDPETKTIVFSDGQTIESAVLLWKSFKEHINVSFGIGTHITNDFDYKPLSIVMKMVKCDEEPVAKLSDSPEKGMCEDPKYLDYLKSVFH
jgi:nicotinate phosphoribosyltransferase